MMIMMMVIIIESPANAIGATATTTTSATTITTTTTTTRLIIPRHNFGSTKYNSRCTHEFTCLLNDQLAKGLNLAHPYLSLQKFCFFLGDVLQHCYWLFWPYIGMLLSLLVPAERRL
jgi:hypothetical protein